MKDSKDSKSGRTRAAEADGSPQAGERVLVYDTTLRDGAQSEHVSFSLEDKLDIARCLDEIGVDFIEGGWPGSNPKDLEFFEVARKMRFVNAKIAAFGSTRHAGVASDKDENLRLLAGSGAPALTIFGKSWDLHVRSALRTTLQENLDMIRSSLKFLRPHCEVLVYDAEHFFDGLRANERYALDTLRVAEEAGADWIVLCDTNGGSLPEQVEYGVEKAREAVRTKLGIHTHNDSGLAVANALAAVRRGCRQVQGTINGLGERCGNADLTTVVPALVLKMGFRCLGEGGLQAMTQTSRYVWEVVNLPARDNQPFVGRSAFAHKGGVHVSAILRNASTYEHADPAAVGNERRFLVSELSGRSNLLAVAGEKFGLADRPDKMRQVLEQVRRKEAQGYAYEAADASLEILIRKVLGTHKTFFKLLGFRVIVDVRQDGTEMCEGTIRIEVGGEQEHTASEGNGPVNALDGALRKALYRFYPELKDVTLADYKVRVINAKAATMAKVLVHITSTDGRHRWTTVGASENILEASWIALVDSVEYKLMRERENGTAGKGAGTERGGATAG